MQLKKCGIFYGCELQMSHLTVITTQKNWGPWHLPTSPLLFKVWTLILFKCKGAAGTCQKGKKSF